MLSASIFKSIFDFRIWIPNKHQLIAPLIAGPLQVKCRILNYDIFLNEFLTYFWKCLNLIYDKKMSEIQSKICRNL